MTLRTSDRRKYSAAIKGHPYFLNYKYVLHVRHGFNKNTVFKVHLIIYGITVNGMVKLSDLHFGIFSF